VSGNSLAARLFGPFGRLFDLRGRTARRDFWPYMLLLIASWPVCLFAVFTVLGGSPLAITFAMTSPAGWFMPADILFLPFMLLGFAAVARRLHDIGLNALPMIVYVLLDGASIGCFYMLAHHAPRVAGSSNAVRAAELNSGLLLGMPFFFTRLCFFVIVVMCALAGERGPNRYGPDPRESGGT
jgi:uncharacterized membrane protein YhaH (DUF805 family)